MQVQFLGAQRRNNLQILAGIITPRSRNGVFAEALEVFSERIKEIRL